MFQGLSNGLSGKRLQIAVGWSIYVIKPNSCVELLHRRNTTVSLETTALRKKGTPDRGLDGEVTHEKGFCLPLNDILQKRNETENIILLFAKVAKIETVILKVATNPLNPKSDQHQISPFNFNTLLKHSGHEN